MTRKTRMLLLRLSVLGLMGCLEYTPAAHSEPLAVTNPNTKETGNGVVDVFTQEILPQVDVLYMVDNSPSMLDEQQQLASNFPLFLGILDESNVDFHVGVISSDMDDTAHQGRLRQFAGRRFIDVDTVDPELAFGSMAVLGDEGSGDERGRDAIYEALTTHKDGYNDGFLRQTAALVIVPISDEDDHSYVVSLTEFESWAKQAKAQPDWVRISSVVSPSPLCETASEVGTNYIALTNAFPGTVSSVCSSRWDELMVKLGLETVGFRTEFFLSRVPKIGSIAVEVSEDGVVQVFGSTEWIYDAERNSVAFVDELPEPGVQIIIRYES